MAWGLRGGLTGAHHTAEFTALLFGADYFVSEKEKLPGYNISAEQNKKEIKKTKWLHCFFQKYIY